MAEGVRSVRPDAHVELHPVADGGEGTLDALHAARGGTFRRAAVTDPTGRLASAPLLVLAGGTVVLEMAAASGHGGEPRARPSALDASSYATGELIRAAGGRRSRTIVVGVGGSASTDGGTGAAAALGWRFLDRRGRELPLGGGALSRLAAIDGDARLELPNPIVGACDVTNPLLGERGAARAFAPQKGASQAEVEILAAGLETLAARIERDLGLSVARLPGAGAGGGMGAGLLAFLDAELRPGFDVVAEATGLARAISTADLVLTGEGRLDEQTLEGKAPLGVLRLARSERVPCCAVVGELALEPWAVRASGWHAAVSLIETAGPERALGRAAEVVAEATARLVAGLPG